MKTNAACKRLAAMLAIVGVAAVSHASNFTVTSSTSGSFARFIVTRNDIDALGDDSDAADKLYECFLLNCDFGDGDPFFYIDPGTGLATQTVTATFDTGLVSEKFFKASIEFAIPKEPEDPWEPKDPEE